MVQMSRCAKLYAIALTDPHALLGEAVCIPDSLAQPSFKFVSRMRFEFEIGAAGMGGVAVWPMRMLANAACIDPDNGLTFYTASVTKGSYGVTNLGFASAEHYTTGYGPTPGTENIASTTSMFSQADFGVATLRSARLVGSGIKIGYTGAVTNQKGTVMLYRNPVPSSNITIGDDEYQEILQSQDAIRINVRDMDTRNNNGVCFRPLLGTDYSPITAPLAPRNLDPASAPQGMSNRMGYVAFVTGGTPTDTYTVDAVAIFECYGKALPLTKSEGDAPGFAAVASAVASAPPTPNPGVNAAQIMQTAMKHVSAASGQLVRQAGPYFADLAVSALKESIRPRPRTVTKALMGR